MSGFVRVIAHERVRMRVAYVAATCAPKQYTRLHHLSSSNLHRAAQARVAPCKQLRLLSGINSSRTRSPTPRCVRDPCGCRLSKLQDYRYSIKRSVLSIRLYTCVCVLCMYGSGQRET